MAVGDRIKSAWNAFMNKDPTKREYWDYYGSSYGYRPDRIRLSRGNERSIITSIFTRIATDAAVANIQHVMLDENKRFIEEVDSKLNNCLSLEANVDQTGRQLIYDGILSMLDEGCVAIVPTDFDDEEIDNKSMAIYELRVGKILEWFPDKVRIEMYDENRGLKDDVIVPKKMVAIVENPFYPIMNESNSTLQRLIRKLNMLDAVDEQSSSGKLDLIIQLPYIIKSTARKQQAEQRRRDIERQLAGSKYGIAYTDGTEHITQLNRSVENNLMNQIEYLFNLLYSQLGLTPEIMNGTADEKTMNNYYNRIIEPILSAFVNEMKRKFLSKTARDEGQSICFYRDPFKLVATTDLAELADKFTRNEIMTSNEFRQVVGMKPSKDPKADELRNKNLSPSNDEIHRDVDGSLIKLNNNNGEENQNE